MSLRECVVCKTNENSEYYCTLEGSEYLKCNSCGLIYVDKLDTTEQIYTAYSGGWLKSLRRKLLAPFRKLHHMKSYEYVIRRADKIFSMAAGYATAEKGKYLDIGCNKGYLLDAGIKRGWDVYGAEIVPELMVPFKNTYKEYADHVYSGRFCDVRPNFESNTFDLVSAIDVIEHFEDPVADIKGIFEILKPGGTFFIQTPEADCERAIKLKDKWGALKPLEHLNLFTRDNLETFVKDIGFVDYVSADPVDDADGNFIAAMKKPAA